MIKILSDLSANAFINSDTKVNLFVLMNDIHVVMYRHTKELIINTK